MKSCGNSKRYKGIRRPTCDHGRACDECFEKYAEKHTFTNKDGIVYKLGRGLATI